MKACERCGAHIDLGDATCYGCGVVQWAEGALQVIEVDDRTRRYEEAIWSARRSIIASGGLGAPILYGQGE